MSHPLVAHWPDTIRERGTVERVKGEAEGRHVQAVKGALAEAQQEMAEQGD
ncbi:MAG: hypothetical protein WB771_13360 [Solirubrobacterales bacterium]